MKVETASAAERGLGPNSWAAERRKTARAGVAESAGRVRQQERKS